MFAQIVCPWGSHIRAHIYMHTQSERFNLNPLIQSQHATQDVNEIKSLSLIGPQWAHRSNTHVCISKQIFLFEYSACFLTLRGSWTTNWRTRTTLCLFLHFMEGRTASPPPPPTLHPTSRQHITWLDAADVSARTVTSEVIDVGPQEWKKKKERNSVNVCVTFFFFFLIRMWRV